MYIIYPPSHSTSTAFVLFIFSGDRDRDLRAFHTLTLTLAHTSSVHNKQWLSPKIGGVVSLLYNGTPKNMTHSQIYARSTYGQSSCSQFPRFNSNNSVYFNFPQTSFIITKRHHRVGYDSITMCITYVPQRQCGYVYPLDQEGVDLWIRQESSVKRLYIYALFV